MGHVEPTNNVGSNTRSDLSPPLILHYNPDWNVLLTLAANSPFIRKVAILMKFNWQLLY